MNVQTLSDWPRPLFKQGGGHPHLFYAVFGIDIEHLNVSGSKHRCGGVPDGLSLLTYGPDTNLEIIDSFCTGYLWDTLCEEQPDIASQIKAQRTCAIVQGEIEDDTTLNYFRDTIGLLTALLDTGAIAIFDPQSFKWWAPQTWRDIVFNSMPADPYPHVVILVSDDLGGGLWYHTRGMRKFGRPDLSINRVRPHQADAVTELINRFIRIQAQGAVILDGQEVKMATLPSGICCRHRGQIDDPDFNNVHIEIEWR